MAKKRRQAKAATAGQPVGLPETMVSLDAAGDRLWVLMREALLDACRDGSLEQGLPDGEGAAHVAVLLSLLEEHPKVAQSLFRAGFQHAMMISTAALEMMDSGVCPVHGISVPHAHDAPTSRVGRA